MTHSENILKNIEAINAFIKTVESKIVLLKQALEEADDQLEIAKDYRNQLAHEYAAALLR